MQTMQKFQTPSLAMDFYTVTIQPQLMWSNKTLEYCTSSFGRFLVFEQNAKDVLHMVK
jgi:hypothetical protein